MCLRVTNFIENNFQLLFADKFLSNLLLLILLVMSVLFMDLNFITVLIRLQADLGYKPRPQTSHAKN